MDLNVDAGEVNLEHDQQLLRHVTSCNVSCGAHAGDPVLIVSTIREALRLGVNVGAHPGYPDRQNFGRISMDMPVNRLLDHLRFQICAVYGIVNSFRGVLAHVKPHGALYHDLQKSESLAQAFVDLVRSIDSSLKIVGQPSTCLSEQAQQAGLTWVSEGFADRRYESANQLRSRSQDGAMLVSTKEVSRQVELLTGGLVVDTSGRQHSVSVDTICIHGDGQHAHDFASTARNIIDRVQ